MTRSLPGGGSAEVATTDDPILASVHDRLERARRAIEERFLAGGTALMAAHEIVGELLAAIEATVAVLDDADAIRATATLTETVTELRDRIESEGHRRAEFDEIILAGAAIPPRIKEMHGILGYIGTCATATRITGAGHDEFIGFADDIARYVRDATTEIGRFSEHVGEINTRLHGIGGEGDRALAEIRRAAPRVSETLLDAGRVIARRRQELAGIAEQTAQLVHRVQDKVETVLSALQIGDVTRQRIEHVRDGIRLATQMAGGTGDGDRLRSAALRLFAALVDSLNAEFTEQTRHVVETIRSLAADAEAIIDLHHRMIRSDDEAGGDPMRTLESAIAAAGGLAAGIDEAQRRVAAVREATGRLAAELLDDAGDIGNLRDVRDDIRCLAINAYLRCSRMGDKGRAVGVIATEMSTSGERLGSVAEAILDGLDGVRRRAAGSTETAVGRDLSKELDEVVAVLRHANAATRTNLELVARRGGTVVERIGRIAQELDFGESLGDMLDECEQTLREDRRAAVDPKGMDSSLLEKFSEEIFRNYTMASERNIHAALFDMPIPTEEAPRGGADAGGETDDTDDCFL
jgi:methyl-accepting chemotaxis protein